MPAGRQSLSWMLAIAAAAIVVITAWGGWFRRGGTWHVETSHDDGVVSTPATSSPRPSRPDPRAASPARSESPEAGPLNALLGAVIRVADDAAHVAAGGGDEAALQRLLESASDATRAGLDVVDDAALPPLDPDLAREFGESFRASVLAEHPRVTDPVAVDLVASAWNDVVAASGEQPNSLTLTVVDDPAVNAFAFVGRNVVVNRGFLDFAAECSRPGEVVRFALAHELGHVVLGHTDVLFRRLVAAEAIVPGAGVAAVVVESLVRHTPMNQSGEREADCFARRMHVANGWSLEGGREFFARTLRLSGRSFSGRAIDGLLGSHPQEGRRVELLETGSGCGDE